MAKNTDEIIDYKCKTCNFEGRTARKRLKNKNYNQCNNCFLPKHECNENCNNILKDCIVCKNSKTLNLFKKSRISNSKHTNLCLECTNKEGKIRQLKNYKLNNKHNCEINECNLRTKHCNFCKKYHNLNFFSLAKSSSKSSHGECIYKSYIKSSIRRNINFNLKRRKFWEIINQPCHYCGENSKYVLRGIDRLNNNLGYTLSNSVACCSDDNMAKGSMSYEKYWRLIIKHIIENSKNLNNLKEKWNAL